MSDIDQRGNLHDLQEEYDDQDSGDCYFAGAVYFGLYLFLHWNRGIQPKDSGGLSGDRRGNRIRGNCHCP